MKPRDTIDASGAVALIAFSFLLGFNQIAIKFTNEGLQPVFWAGLRSVIAAICVVCWIRLRDQRLQLTVETVPAGLISGLIFSAEFLFLFLALDFTTVVRVSVIFYAMPVWLAIAAHFFIPNEKLSASKTVGLCLSMAGVSWAIFSRTGDLTEGSIIGDLFALAASMAWAGIPLSTRLTKLRKIEPESQLFWHVIVSAPVLLIISPVFGPAIRDFQPLHTFALAFQAVVVVAGGFMLWLHLLRRYPASNVASFSFLTPISGVLLGWMLLGEEVGKDLVIALILVSIGLVLINRVPKQS